ncbi:hypothetical protein FSARC_7052 [Fusarium sarcochroum]|uniref:Spherulin 4 n=1 Tax=Fusarium sarcochroum TaxID=1208366 RepID=A0A8H4TVW1_9HYPO|nr:hypothetical protein FSARC_7052 [Fusarium sarcochroum]
MQLSTSISLLVGQAISIAATGILLPLYKYPSQEVNDGAVNWKPAFDAIASDSNNQWLVVVNPWNGPGATGRPGDDDPNYITATGKLNSYANVKTVGYVRTNYGKAPLDELKANITSWSLWATYTETDIAVHGIFFDESSADFDYLNEAITFTRSAFGESVTTVCNFGTKAAAEYYDICDVVVAFESALNSAGFPPYESETTLRNNVPNGYEAQAAIILNEFTGTASDGATADQALINNYVKAIRQFGLGWFYFTSANYDTINALPATVGANARALSDI